MALILNAIQLARKYVIANQNEFMRKVREASPVRQTETAKELKRKMGKAERRVKELDMLLKNPYEELHRHLVHREVLHVDETTLQVLHEPEKKLQNKSYMWLYRTSGV